MPRGIVRFLAHVIAGRCKRIGICGYVHQRLDLGGQGDSIGWILADDHAVFIGGLAKALFVGIDVGQE